MHSGAANMPAMIEEFQEAWEELTAPGAQFATTTIDVRGVPIKVFESALPSMRTVWELARGYGDRDYIVYEDERYTYAESDAIIRALAAPARRRVRRAARRPGGDRHAQLSRVGVRLLGDRVDRCGVRRHECLVDLRRDGVRPRRLATEGAHRRRRARRARASRPRCAARRGAAAPDDRALRR